MDNRGISKEFRIVFTVLSLLFVAFVIVTTFYGGCRDTATFLGETVLLPKQMEGHTASDYILWSGVLSRRDVTMAMARDRLNEDSDKVKVYLLRKGFRPSEMHFSAITESMINRALSDDDRPGDYVASRQIEVRTNNIALVNSISKQTMRIVGRGIDLRMNSPKPCFSKLDEMPVKPVSFERRTAPENEGVEDDD